MIFSPYAGAAGRYALKVVGRGIRLCRHLPGRAVQPSGSRQPRPQHLHEWVPVRVRGWAGYLATADLQMATMPIPVAQIAARGAADGSGLGGPIGVAALRGNVQARSWGRAGTPFVVAQPGARGMARSALRGAITLPGTAISALGQARSGGRAAASLTTRNGPQINVIV